MQPADQTSIRVMIVDDHAVVRTGLRVVIENQPGLAVIAEAANRSEAVQAATATRPDLILLDLDLGEDHGIDALPELLAAVPGVRVLLLTGLRDAELHRRAVRLGASGVVLKDSSPAVILKAIAKVSAGEVWLERSMIAHVLGELVRPAESDPTATRIAALTSREREIIALIGTGLRNQQIAQQLSLSEATIRNHLTSILSKLQLADRVELVVYAYRHQLAKLP